jgi:hypothetical protein
MTDIVIIGGGAAGMMAAITAAEGGKNIVLIEKNDRLGKKLFITGKGRCNLTNACDADNFFRAVTTNNKFMYSSFYDFDNQKTIEFFNELGLKTKVERGDRVFPVSDHSSDVIGVLKTKINRCNNIKVMLNTCVTEVLTEAAIEYDNETNDMAHDELSSSKKQKTQLCVTGVKLKGGEIISCNKVILATGGLSYPLTGSTGDGYTFARHMGHTIKETVPSLVPFEVKEDFCKELMGLSLKNVRFVVNAGKKKVFDEQGEMLFTHFGISGPLVIKASAYIHKYLGKAINMYIDLKPALDEATLDSRILRDFDKYMNKDFRNSLSDLLPSKLIAVIVDRSGIDPYKKVNSITKEERQSLVSAIKHFELTFAGLRGYDEAIITKGGINVKEVNPSTMESKLVQGLYIAGEVLDIDAVTGGYNLQIAWSTAHLAGLSATK